MRCENGGEIDGTRALRTIEAPDSLRVVGVHIHRLRAVTPAAGNGNGRAHSLALELFGTGSTLAHTTDGGVGDDTLYGTSVAVAQIALYQILNGLGQIHGLLFKTLADTTLTTVNGRADTNLRIVCLHCLSMFYLLDFYHFKRRTSTFVVISRFLMEAATDDAHL